MLADLSKVYTEPWGPVFLIWRGPRTGKARYFTLFPQILDKVLPRFSSFSAPSAGWLAKTYPRRYPKGDVPLGGRDNTLSAVEKSGCTPDTILPKQQLLMHSIAAMLCSSRERGRPLVPPGHC